MRDEHSPAVAGVAAGLDSLNGGGAAAPNAAGTLEVAARSLRVAMLNLQQASEALSTHSQSLAAIRRRPPRTRHKGAGAAGGVGSVLAPLLNASRKPSFVPSLVADADAKGVLSAHFGVRPVPGDAVLFYMKVPGERKADRHAFHAGCPLVRGSKDAIQKFLQHGGTNDVSDLRNHGRGRAGAYGRCEK